MTESKENLSDDAPKPTSKLCKHVRPVKNPDANQISGTRMAKVEFGEVQDWFLVPEKMFCQNEFIAPSKLT